MASAEDPGFAPPEPISPELVLVDPRLRELVLDPGPEVAADEPAAVANGKGTAPSVTEPPFTEPPNGGSSATGPAAGSRSTARRWIVLALAAALFGSLATLGAGLAIWGLTGSAATKSEGSAAPSVPGPAGTVPSSKPRSVVKTGNEPHKAAAPRTTTAPRVKKAGRASKAAVTPAPRRFAWAPVSGATAYAVAVYKGGAVVFRAKTASTSIVIPGRSKQARSQPVLRRGTYKWYVWPIRRGRLDRVAVVRSTFVVP